MQSIARLCGSTCTSFGYVAEMSENGVQCLEKWKTGAYDVLLTDGKMPEMVGFRLTSQMRAIRG